MPGTRGRCCTPRRLPFDHVRRATSTLVDDNGDRVLVVKGAPEQVLARCQMTCRATQHP